MPESQHVTQLLMDWSRGDGDALEQLLPLVQRELRRLASSYMRRERPGHTLQTTALINEAYMRLVDQQVAWESRAQFFGIAARLMRQILVDHARAQSNAKRGGDRQQVSLAIAEGLPQKSSDLLALDDALQNLAAIGPRQSQIVELRYFGGLTVEETAQVLGISTATVERQWRAARAWLHKEMS